VVVAVVLVVGAVLVLVAVVLVVGAVLVLVAVVPVVGAEVVVAGEVVVALEALVLLRVVVVAVVGDVPDGVRVVVVVEVPDVLDELDGGVGAVLDGGVGPGANGVGVGTSPGTPGAMGLVIPTDAEVLGELVDVACDADETEALGVDDVCDGVDDAGDVPALDGAAPAPWVADVALLVAVACVPDLVCADLVPSAELVAASAVVDISTATNEPTRPSRIVRASDVCGDATAAHAADVQRSR
jgi:hypothetical protein